ncbi:Fpg/Nei family DNA glycosylase [Microbacterium sp. zg.Y1090]|uniref:DNA-formamidopyrimidine glycosylase family protein n=1 Tax=Microbacterium TaxID=33882 RepID=UPI00214AE6C7|nr:MULTISPECIES: DNA-formamidopyrimidine glycosylase family protein [unclassified Microbacterium]MCR2813794.1 Fpg/Nei family DNA glycosylase [Microbacterium sp. zg.Y1084]MCR2819692.1 Fpg/Nei family DNA glycosylase [Microbacterium sp. zg.Y1090]MDL5487540.1 DNA-formamidopyrimidine glycosylase family protein [Microbacterium sp. zg-Y1211]WIM28064.1 DNA-formamidopyrimidine glycosylase family protein [Microbacterium sp. zg-Y1090]
MPEGDTVFRTARRLNDALAGGVITRFDIRVPGSATADLRGETVHDVVARGKHLLLRAGAMSLHSHLKMEGEWHVYSPDGRWRRPGYTARAIVGTAEADAVGFDLAMVEVLPTSAEDRVVGHLGPDPLSDHWDAAEAARRLAADDRAVHVALLDQRNVAGFGNVYANEVLFVRGILPDTPASTVDVAGVIDTGARMIRTNRDRSRRVFTGDARPGQGMWVYGRDGKPCRRCGTLVRSSSLGARPTSDRNVFWCPVCQH